MSTVFVVCTPCCIYLTGNGLDSVYAIVLKHLGCLFVYKISVSVSYLIVLFNAPLLTALVLIRQTRKVPLREVWADCRLHICLQTSGWKR